MKKCRRCFKNKELSEYYKHKEMFDGRLNICKECTKKRVSLHREKNIDSVREYDRNRPNAKERNKKQLERVKNLSIKKKREYKKVKDAWHSKQENKNKKTVNSFLSNAIRDGRKTKLEFCEHCGTKDVELDGHHPSYLNPLDVIWLCKLCHGAEHKRLNELKRKDKA